MSGLFSVFFSVIGVAAVLVGVYAIGQRFGCLGLLIAAAPVFAPSKVCGE